SILLCIFILPGCKAKPGGTDANQVKEKVSEAVETTDSYLAEQKDAAIKKSQETYDNVQKETKELITKIRSSSVQGWQEMSSSLEAKMDTAQQKLDELNEAGQDKVQAAESAFDTAIKELKDTYEKTKAAYEKTEQKD
ncbi:MAG: hypothetical protein P8016_05230, partial [Sedimentisphaerales bacterium]